MHFIITHGKGAANLHCRSLFGMTREQLAAFIERNRDMLPDDGR